MSLENVDFQAIVHQYVSELVASWQAAEFGETEIQEAGSQFFQYGGICANQLIQEKGLTPQGATQMIAYTQPMAERILSFFLYGLNTGLLKAHEMKLPRNETWMLLQQVALHVFEQAKQAVIATLGQEHTPEVQISDEQIINWLGQTAVEALIYFINEYEAQHGPIARTDEQTMPNLLSVSSDEAEVDDETEDFLDDLYPEAEEPEAPAPQPKPEPRPQPVAAEAPATSQAPEVHHKLAAVALMLNTASPTWQRRILSSFDEEEQGIIRQYRDPDRISQNLDLGRVARHLKSFKDKLHGMKPVDKSPYAKMLHNTLKRLPPDRLHHLFAGERPLVREYVSHFTHAEQQKFAPPDLPPGVEEAMMLYLERNFPQEVGAR